MTTLVVPKKPMRTLVIKASEWLRGASGSRSALRAGTDSGIRYCCLGLDARACGVPEDELDGRGSPLSVFDNSKYGGKIKHWLDAYQEGGDNYEGITADSPDAMDAMLINDNTMTTDDQKIRALIPIFERAGIIIDWRPNE